MAGFDVPWTEILNYFLTSHIDFLFIFGQGGDIANKICFWKEK